MGVHCAGARCGTSMDNCPGTTRAILTAAFGGLVAGRLAGWPAVINFTLYTRLG